MARIPFGIASAAGGLALIGAALVGAPGAAQDSAAPARPSHIHSGDCDEPGAVIQPLTSLTAPGETVLGNSDAVVAEAAFSNVPLSLDAMLAADHSLKVHFSRERIEVYLACGDIGGALDQDGALIVGLKELDGSGYTGIAYLVPAANGSTNISVMIAKVLPGTEGPAATAAADLAAAGAPAGAATAAAENQPAAVTQVDVTLTEFAIEMPTDLPQGPIRFNVRNEGGAPHSFVVEGQGGDARLADNLAPGTSATLDVDLAPGTYTVFCPVGDGAHRARGMELAVTVG